MDTLTRPDGVAIFSTVQYSFISDCLILYYIFIICLSRCLNQRQHEARKWVDEESTARLPWHLFRKYFISLATIILYVCVIAYNKLLGGKQNLCHRTGTIFYGWKYFFESSSSDVRPVEYTVYKFTHNKYGIFYCSNWILFFVSELD